MSDLSAEQLQRLDEFIVGALQERRAGKTIEAIEDKVDALRSTVGTVADGLAAHQRECLEYRERTAKAEEERHRSHEERLRSIESKSPSRHPRPLAPDLDPGLSENTMVRFGDKLVEAVREGIRRPDTTPEQMVQRVVEDETERLAQKKRLAELEADDRARRERLRAAVKLLIAIAGTVPSWELIKLFFHAVGVGH
jgi:hypothetical protein